MSDHNWTKCPKCKGPDVEAVMKSLSEAYGKVTQEEYVALSNRAALAEDKYTFKEYFMVGTTDEGVLEIQYGGKCTYCGFSYEYTLEKDLKGDLNPPPKHTEVSLSYNSDLNRLKRMCVSLLREIKNPTTDPEAPFPLSDFELEAVRIGIFS